MPIAPLRADRSAVRHDARNGRCPGSGQASTGGGRIPATGPASFCPRLWHAATSSLKSGTRDGRVIMRKTTHKSTHRHFFVEGLCNCGQRHSGPQVGAEAAVGQAVEQALLHGLFPEPILRRTVLKSVGAATVLGALSTLLPLETLKAIAQEKKPLEKVKLNVGFLPITCAAPLIYGEHLGHYAKEGLEVSLQKIAGINLIRDKMINGELDVSQQVMPVALTMTVGLGGNTQSIKVLTICNQNGNSLVLANKHKTNRDPKNWKGFVFAVPFEQSHQALQLRNLIASHGVDPDKDVQYRVIPPTEYVSSLRVGNIDGFFGGEPGGQRAVYENAGFIHAISRDIWEGHPCCSVAAAEAWY